MIGYETICIRDLLWYADITEKQMLSSAARYKYLSKQERELWSTESIISMNGKLSIQKVVFLWSLLQSWLMSPSIQWLSVNTNIMLIKHEDGEHNYVIKINEH